MATLSRLAAGAAVPRPGIAFTRRPLLLSTLPTPLAFSPLLYGTAPSLALTDTSSLQHLPVIGLSSSSSSSTPPAPAPSLAPTSPVPPAPAPAPAPAAAPAPSTSEPPGRVFVAGATGRTGQRIVKALAKRGVSVQAGVRNQDKAKQLFKDLDQELLHLVDFDVLNDLDSIAAAIDPEADAIIVATGFSPEQGSPPNLLLPWQIDCQGTIKIVDAARRLGIGRLVLVSSLLTNGAAWGQAFNPAYLFLNLFGLVLIAKLQAERYIQRSGINFTIVRPGGLRETPPKGNIVASSEDTLSAGSISRDSVAEVAVEALYWKEAGFKIVEIIEEEGAPKKSFQELFQEVK